MDMVERVAKAMFQSPGRGYAWEEATPGEQASAVRYAIAAISAMREPTRELIGAQHYGTDSERRANWLDAIDSILKSTRETA
jgi:hypothetical protein